MENSNKTGWKLKWRKWEKMETEMKNGKNVEN